MPVEVAVAAIGFVGLVVTVGLPLVFRKVDYVGQRVSAVDHELRPNSGGSARDVLDRIEHRMTLQDERQLEMRRELNEHRRDFRDHLVKAAEEAAVLDRLSQVLADRDAGPQQG